MTELIGAVYLDANVFIDALEGEQAAAQPAEEFLRHLRAYPRVAITSELTLAEILARPERERLLPLKRAYLNLIVSNRFIELKSVTRRVLLDSAKYRAVHTPGLKLPDAIHLVTAGQSRCQLFVSRDTGINPPVGMTRISADVSALATLLRGR